MKMKEFVKNLNQLLKDRPEAAELEVVTAKDDEGNGYSFVRYEPSIGVYDGEDFSEEQKPNAICIN